MPEYSEQDLKYAAEFRDGIHKEALSIVRKTHPNVTEVIDRHPVEDYFQENWEYPGKMYTIVAIPYGYKSRQALVDQIVRDTLSGNTYDKELTSAQALRDMASRKNLLNQLDTKQDDYEELLMTEQKRNDDPFYTLISEYSNLVVEYFIVKEKRHGGYESHRRSLKTAFSRFSGEWNGNPDQAVGKRVSAEEMFSSDFQDGKLNYRKAFLYPPHQSGYTDKDFARVNAALFPNGIDGLEVYEWSTDWSEYFDDGHEWWGTLCLTVYDKTLDRFVVIMATATD